MTNYVPLNNTILHDIVRCFTSQRIFIVLCMEDSQNLSKILLFPEDCTSQGLSQDPYNKKAIY